MAARGSDGGLVYHHAPFHEAQSLSQNRDTARTRVSFYLSPDPLLRAFPHLRALNSPPPPGRREGRAMISICRGVFAYGLPLSHRPVPSHSFIARSTARNRLAGYPRRFCQAHRLSDTEWRGGLGASSRRRRFPGLRFCVLLFAQSGAGDGTMMPLAYQSADAIDGGRRRSISGGLFFRYDSVLVRLRRSVLLFAQSGAGDGTGACLSSLVPLSVR